MNQVALRSQLEGIDAQLTDADPQVEALVRPLYNLLEQLAQENEALREENEALRREVETAKGTEGRTQQDAGKPKKRKQVSTQHRREKDPQSPAHGDRRTFLPLEIHETVPCPVDRTKLPDDAIQYEDQKHVVRDLIIRPHNICYRQEAWYSPSRKRWYVGELPDEAKGTFGAHLRTSIVTLKYIGGMSEPKIEEFLENYEISISAGSISNILQRTAKQLASEKGEIVRAGLASTDYQQIDDTSARVAGEFWHTHILCNEFYSAFFTQPNKDRLTVLRVLQNDTPLQFVLDEQTLQLLAKFGIPAKWQQWAAEHSARRIYEEEQWSDLLDTIFKAGRCQQTREYFDQAGAISYYHQQTLWPLFEVILTDDADQFKRITPRVGLCWIHEGRHYERFEPRVPRHRQALDTFIDDYWKFYHRLKTWREAKLEGRPSRDSAGELKAAFETLFSTRTGYDALDDRISKTQAKQKRLLVALDYPMVPLHNNNSELGARVCARRRDVSLHSRSKSGVVAMDLFTTIVQTAKKLGISGYRYLYDRISGAKTLPSLADLIQQAVRAKKYLPEA